MAVRLQLELREFAGHLMTSITTHVTLGRDSSSQVGQNVKGNRMDAFRTIPFDSWLRLFMQVRDPYVDLCKAHLIFLSVCVHFDDAWRTRLCRGAPEAYPVV